MHGFVIWKNIFFFEEKRLSYAQEAFQRFRVVFWSWSEAPAVERFQFGAHVRFCDAATKIKNVEDGFQVHFALEVETLQKIKLKKLFWG